MCEDYNGWSNYETWCMNLWNGNEQGVDDTLREECRDMYKNYRGEDKYKKTDVTYNLSKYMEGYCYEVWLGEFSTYNFNHSTGPIGDFVNSSWKMINWYEIAEHYYEETDNELR